MSRGSSSPNSKIETGARLPAGHWLKANIFRRRLIVALSVIVFSLTGLVLLSMILQSTGWGLGDSVILFAAFILFPILALEAVTSVIGFGLRHFVKDGLERAAPYYRRSDFAPLITAKTAIVMMLRNDAVEDAVHRLKILRNSLESMGEGGRFSYFLLSDTSDPVLAKREDDLVREWNRALPDYAPIIYRRRLVTAGNKAGVLIDFCRHWGDGFDFVVPLDVSSFITGAAVLDLVRVMQSNPKIGIVQSLILRLPERSTFARILAFADRYQVRLRALGAAWWQADCATYYGRNAILRVAPFFLHCRMPHLPGRSAFSGPVIEHQTIEAALMQSAGYEVLGLPVETGSYADCPTSIFDLVKHLAALEQGELQLARFLTLPKISFLYRLTILQRLFDAVLPLMWTLAICFFAIKAFEVYEPSLIPVAGVKATYLAFLVIMLAPRLLGALDIMLDREQGRKFGNRISFLVSVMIESMLALLLQALFHFRAAFTILKTPLRRLESDKDKASADKPLKRRSAFKSFWPVSLFGMDLILFMLIGSPTYTAWSLPLTLGFLLAVPVAAFVSSGWVLTIMDRIGLFAGPETKAPPREMMQLMTGTRRD